MVWKVDGYAAVCTVGNGFPKLGGSLDAAKDTRITDDGEPGRLPLKIREAAPGMGNVRGENERELALNIERGLNSKISLRAAHWARSLQAPAFERERWVLRDRNIYLRTREGKKRVRECQWEGERQGGSEVGTRKREKIVEGKREWRKGRETTVPARPWIHRENNVSGLTRGPWPLTCSFR